MKKLMFATALVASVAAFADTPTAINAVGFEGYTPGYTFQNYGSESNDVGGDGPYFYFEGTSNSSVVTNETPSSTKRTACYAEYTNSKYLALDTEGGTFWRGLKQTKRTESEEEGEDPTYSLGDGQKVASTGTYLDTLVQFTVTEDGAPTTTADDKLAIWLGVVTNAQGDVTGTNLMVRAKAWSFIGDVLDASAADFVIANSPVEAGVWYRLTVKAVQTIVDPGSNLIIPAFQIYIDGTAVAATTPQISADLQATFTGGQDIGGGQIQPSVWLPDMADLAAANKLFPTLAENPGSVTDVTLQGVGFQGTGAVDEIVWTEEDLSLDDGLTVVDYTFTLTLDANVTTAAVTTNGAAVVFDNGTAQILAGTAVSIAKPTFGEGFQLAAFTVDNTAETVASWPYTFTMTADKTVSITSARITTYALTLPVVANATAAVTADGTPVPNLAAIPAGTDVVVTWTVTDPNYEITAGATENITMNGNVTARSPTVAKKANWVDDVTTITAGTKASDQYPSLAGTAVANADAAQLTTWAKGVGNVLFADAGNDDINVDAFLLNIANNSTAEQIAAEKEAFKLNITIAADGTPVVTLPDGKTYNGTVQLKGSTDLSTWTNVSAASKSYNFYKYELSLPAGE